MKNLILLSFVLLFLSACSPFTLISSSGEQPTPVIENENQPPVSDQGYQPAEIDSVGVEVGVGSPIPVFVNISGNLPDTCAQVELVQQKQEGTTFFMTVSTIPSNAEGCIQDSLPFIASIPLNVVNLPAGTYNVEVNGTAASFELNTGSTIVELPDTGAQITKDDIQIDSVSIDAGVGSPIPVHAVVSGNLPSTCAQLGEIRLHRDGNSFLVRLIAYSPEASSCINDSLPFRLELPLNIVNLPAGTYEVNVNGTTASFDPRPVSSSPEPDAATCSDPVSVPVVDGAVSFNGISFNVDPALGSAVTASTCPELPYSENQAPGEAHPPYTTFFFPGFDRQNVDFQPEVRVYEITGNMSQYTFPLNMLDELRTILDIRPESASWYSHAPMHARQKYLDFASGTGVRSLVQYMQDFFFYTNNGLTYEFNGLSQDGHHFVSVRYPVRVPFLMELADPFTLPPNNINPEAIAFPEWPQEYEQQTEVIKAYNHEALSRLEQMADSEATPGLAALDNLVQSIKVMGPGASQD